MRVSLCLIAKDEEELLPGCLDSVRAFVDQMVVVDCNSRDATPQLAHDAGALVVHHRWHDDFAAARNAGLRACSGDWILQLDADERLFASSARQFKRCVERATFDCGLVALYDAQYICSSAEAVLGGSERRGEPQLLPRLLRRDARLCYRGIIHENLDHWLACGKRIAAISNASIVHYGNASDHPRRLVKQQRNLALLRQRCAAEPENPTARSYFAYALLASGQREQARIEVEHAWQRLCDREFDAATRPTTVPVATLLAYLQRDEGNPQLALRTLAHAAHGVPKLNQRHPNLLFAAGLCHEAIGTSDDTGRGDAALSRAAQHYRACLAQCHQVFAQSLNPAGCASWLAATRLGTVELLRRHFDRAADAFTRALAWRPAHPEAQLGLAESWLETGKLQQSLALASSLLQSKQADAWVIVARAAAHLDCRRQLPKILRRAARAASRGGFSAPHRRRHLAQLLQRRPA